MKLTKILKENIPYIMFFYLGNIFSSHVREYRGGDFIDRLSQAFSEIGTMSYFPSFNLYDLGIGFLFAVVVKFIVYTKGKRERTLEREKSMVQQGGEMKKILSRT